MTSEHALAQLRHRDDTGRGDARRLEALVDREPEHKRKTARQAREQGRSRHVIEAQVLAYLLLQRRAIAPVRRLGFFLFEELQVAGDGVRRAGAERTLVVTRCEALAQVDLRGKRARDPRRGLIATVALVGNVSDPAEVLDTHG